MGTYVENRDVLVSKAENATHMQQRASDDQQQTELDAGALFVLQSKDYFIGEILYGLEVEIGSFAGDRFRESSSSSKSQQIDRPPR